MITGNIRTDGTSLNNANIPNTGIARQRARLREPDRRVPGGMQANRSFPRLRKWDLYALRTSSRLLRQGRGRLLATRMSRATEERHMENKKTVVFGIYTTV